MYFQPWIESEKQEVRRNFSKNIPFFCSNFNIRNYKRWRHTIKFKRCVHIWTEGTSSFILSASKLQFLDWKNLGDTLPPFLSPLPFKGWHPTYCSRLSEGVSLQRCICNLVKVSTSVYFINRRVTCGIICILLCVERNKNYIKKEYIYYITTATTLVLRSNCRKLHIFLYLVLLQIAF